MAATSDKVLLDLPGGTLNAPRKKKKKNPSRGSELTRSTSPPLAASGRARTEALNDPYSS